MHSELTALATVIIIDLVLAGDNAVVVGMAAAGLPNEVRKKAIIFGIAAAAGLRIVFAIFTAELLNVIGLVLAGGLLLLWVCWKLWRELRSGSPNVAALDDDAADANPYGRPGGGGMGTGPRKTMGQALTQIVVADVSMSLDNVLAVAGAAKGSTLVLVIGLTIAIVLMAVASHFIAGLLVKYPWITWIGLLIILWVALSMIYQGSHEVLCRGFGAGCSDSLWDGILQQLRFGPGPVEVLPPAP